MIFPINPTINQIYSEDNKNWIWTGISWIDYNPAISQLIFLKGILSGGNASGSGGKLIADDVAYNQLALKAPLSSPVFTNSLSLVGNSSTDSPTLGSELLTGGTWTSINWTGNNTTGWTHIIGNTTSLSYSSTVTVDNFYQIAVTRTGGTTGFATMTIGGAVAGTISALAGGAIYYHAPKALTTTGLVITPGSTFDGTLIVSVRQITGISTSLFSLQDSGGNTRIEIRGNNITGNTFIGNGVGRYNTTGTINTAQGVNALYYNTTGYSNSAQGVNALYYNTTGYSNSAQGVNALYYNTTGFNNTAQGVNALYYNTTGYRNSAQGFQALFYNTTGSYNSAQGGYALYSNTTNIATLGAITGGSSYTNGTYTNVVMTLSSGSTATTYPTANIVVSGGSVTSVALVTGGIGFKDTTTVLTAPAASIGGTGSGFSVPVSTLATGQNNNAIGYNAGRYITGGSVSNYVGTNSLFIGNGTQALADGQTNQIVIGDSAIGEGSNTTVIGNSSTNNTHIYGYLNSSVTTLKEKVNVVANSANNVLNIDYDTSAIWYFTVANSATYLRNFRASSTVTLNSRMAINDSISMVIMATQGATAYLPSSYTIDGNAITPKWANGYAPTSGNINGIDAVYVTIIKTADATFTMLKSLTNFA